MPTVHGDDISFLSHTIPKRDHFQNRDIVVNVLPPQVYSKTVVKVLQPTGLQRDTLDLYHGYYMRHMLPSTEALTCRRARLILTLTSNFSQHTLLITSSIIQISVQQ